MTLYCIKLVRLIVPIIKKINNLSLRHPQIGTITKDLRDGASFVVIHFLAEDSKSVPFGTMYHFENHYKFDANIFLLWK